MKLQYLGTAAAEGWPALFCGCEACMEAQRRGGKNLRRRSGALINDHILIDMSADLYFAKIDLKLDLSKVRNILVTHAHEDHFYPENLANYFPVEAYMENHTPLHIYGSTYTKEVYEKRFYRPDDKQMQEYLVFHELKPYDTFQVENLTVTALPADHGCKDSLMYLIQDGDEEWLYAHDTGYFREENWQYLKGHKFAFVSMDCTNGPLKLDYYGHMGFMHNIPLRERMLKEHMADENTVFVINHFSHNGHMLHEEMEKEMNPKGFLVSYDGMILQGK